MINEKAVLFTWIFDLDMQKCRLNMSSLVKTGIDDPGLSVCEYRLSVNKF